jgi:hypothetical protein
MERPEIIESLSAYLPSDDPQAIVILDHIEGLYREGRISGGDLQWLMDAFERGLYTEILHKLDHWGVGNPPMEIQYGSAEAPTLKFKSSESEEQFLVTSEDLPEPEEMPNKIDELIDEVL